MASIALPENEAWVGPAWVLRSIARRLQTCGNFPSLAKQFEAIDEGWQHLGLRKLDAAERAELRRVAPLMLEEVRKAGPSILPEQEFYPVFVAAFEEFERLVRLLVIC